MTLQAAILVGGLGTRLGNLTRSIPKPMLMVGGKPFLEHLIANLARHGFEQILLLTGHLSDQVSPLACRSTDFGVQITCVVEPYPAGTAGAVANASCHLAEKFLLLNGDSFFDINYLDLTTGSDSDIGTVALLERDVSRYGAVEIDGSRIVEFHERSPTPGARLINGGIYWLRREILSWIPAGPASLERDVLPRLAEERRLSARIYDRYFIDIGIPEDFELAQGELAAQLDRKTCLFHFSDLVGPVVAQHLLAEVKESNDSGRMAVALSERPVSSREIGQVQAKLRQVGAHLDEVRWGHSQGEELAATLGTSPL